MKKKKNETFEWVKTIIGALVIVFIIRYFFFTPIVVEGDSMNPTLLDKDHMVVTKILEPMLMHKIGRVSSSKP